MARRRLLSDEQLAPFWAWASDERAMVRHYTLSQADLDLIAKKRTASNQLGSAVLMCRARPGQGRVRHIAPQAAQDRRSRGEPRPLGLRRRLSRGRALRRPTRRAHAARTLNDRAQRPLSPCRFLQRVQQCRSRCSENNRMTNRVRSQPAQTEPDDHTASRIDRVNVQF